MGLRHLTPGLPRSAFIAERRRGIGTAAWMPGRKAGTGEYDQRRNLSQENIVIGLSQRDVKIRERQRFRYKIPGDDSIRYELHVRVYK